MENHEKKIFIKYLNLVYPIVEDEMGFPSTAIIGGDRYRLICSIDRHHDRKVITKNLKEIHSFSDETAEKGAEIYCEIKYNEYKKAVLKL